MFKSIRRQRLAATAILAVLPGLVVSGEVPAARRDLGRAVPSDASLYVHYWLAEPGPGAGTGGQSFADRQAALLDALRGSGYLDATFRGILQKLTASLEPPEAERAAIERTLDRWEEMLAGVDWSGLVVREAAFAARRAGPRVEFLFAFRVPPGELGRILESLRRILYGICATSPELEMSESLRDAKKAMVLYDIADGDELSLGGRDDVVLWASTARLLRHSLQLLAEEGSDLGFAYGRQRADALRGISFVPPAEGFELHARPGALLPEIKELSAIESFALAGSLAFDSISYSFQCKFAPAHADPLRAALLERPAVDEWLRRVPQSAASFHVAAGADLQVLLDLMLPVLRRALPQLGDLGIWGDLARVLSGRRMLLADSSGFAALFELQRSGGRKDFLRLLPRLEKGFESFGLDPQPAALAGEGDEDGEALRSLTLKPILEPKLVFGAAGDFLVLATSPALARDALRASSGKEGGKARDFPEGLHVPAGPRLGLVHEEPPLCLEQARFLLRVLEALPQGLEGALPEGPEGHVFEAILESSSRLESVLDAASFLRCHDACTTREGDSLRGSGRISLGESGKDPREMQF